MKKIILVCLLFLSIVTCVLLISFIRTSYVTSTILKDVDFQSLYILPTEQPISQDFSPDHSTEYIFNEVRFSFPFSKQYLQNTLQKEDDNVFMLRDENKVIVINQKPSDTSAAKYQLFDDQYETLCELEPYSEYNKNFCTNDTIFYKRIFAITPNDLSFFDSPAERITESLLLVIKAEHTKSSELIYHFKTNHIEGYKNKNTNQHNVLRSYQSIIYPGGSLSLFTKGYSENEIDYILNAIEVVEGKE